MKTYDFVIVGSGLAGLSAHHELQKKGYSVVTLEASPIPGGRVKTQKMGEGFSDTGTQFFTFNYPRILKLLKELNIKANKASPLLGHIDKDQTTVINTKNPLGLMTSGLLTKKSFALLFSHILAIKLKNPFLHPESPLDMVSFDNLNAFEYCEKFLNQEITEKFMIPYFSAFNYAHPSELSGALVVRALLHMASGKDLMGLSGGLATLPLALAKGKEIHFNTPVIHVKNDEVMTDSGTYHSRHILLAVTSQQAKKLLGDAMESSQERYYSSSGHEAFLVKKDKRTGSYGTLVSHRKSSDINILTDEGKKSPGLAPLNLDLLGALASGNAMEKDITLEAKTLLNLKDSDIVEHKRTIWKEAIPVLRPGHFRELKNYRENLNSDSKILLAGDYLSTGCAEGAVESGQFIASLFSKIPR